MVEQAKRKFKFREFSGGKAHEQEGNLESGADTGGLVAFQLQVSESVRKDGDEDRVSLGNTGAFQGTQRIIETSGRGPEVLVPPMYLNCVPASWI